jgi:hypothetical protein
MNDLIQNGQHPTHDSRTFTVMVKYITSSKKFVDSHARKDETLATLKPQALEFFTLVEDDAKTYQFSLDGVVQTNLAVTLGSLVGDKHELKLNLTEVLKQG